MPEPDLLHVGCALRPHEASVIQEDRALTFAELDRRAGRGAAALAAGGVRRGDRVALFAYNELEFFELQVACLRVGAVFVPLNFRLAAAEVRAILDDCEPSVVVAGPGLDVRADRVWSLGEEWEQRLDSVLDPVPMCASDPESAAHIMYTSGTTGKAKGAIVSAAALRVRMDTLVQSAAIAADTVLLQSLPLFHLSSSISLAVVRAGGEHVALRSFDPTSWYDVAARRRVTHALVVPTMMSSLIGSPRPTDSLRLMLYGASPIDAELLGRVRSAIPCGLAQMYGMTETGAATMLLPADHDDPSLLASAGTPMPGFELEVRSVDGPLAVPGQTGQIAIRSQALFDGYWRDPAASAEVLRDGWMLTGDAGYIDDDGHVFVTDRIKDIIITGGENVSAREVEEVLCAHPSIAEAAVVGVRDDHWGQRVHAVVVPAETAEAVDEQALDAWCRERIAAYKRPRSYEVVDALPRNATGKVLKHVLRRSSHS